MKRVLVTGASGLLGRALLPRLLDAGYGASCLRARRAGADGRPA